MTTTDRPYKRATTLLLAMCCALFAMTLAYLATRGPVKVDSGIFASSGWHLLNGKALYREVWDSKPPGIFFLNALALAVGGREIESVRTMEMLFGGAAALLVFRIVLVALASRAVAVVTALLFAVQFYSGKVFEGGNLTEEYATVFALAGVLGAVESVHREGKGKLIACAFAAFPFGLAALTKEPFALSALPWFAYSLLARPADGEPRRTTARATIWVAAGLLPIVLVLGLLASQGAAAYWWDSITYHLPTTAWVADASSGEVYGEPSSSLFERLTSNAWPAWNNVLFRIPLTTVAAVCGLIALTSRDFLRRTRYFPLVVVLMFALDYVGTLISPRQYGHYYMQLVGSFVLFAACGGAAVLERLNGLRSRLPSVSTKLRLIAGLLLVAIAAFGIVREDIVGRLQSKLSHARRKSHSAIAYSVAELARPGDQLWATAGNNSRYYLETGLLSPTRFLFVYDHVFVDTWLDSGTDKLAQLRSDLDERTPRFVVVSDGATLFLEQTDLLDWIRSNYELAEASDPDENARGYRSLLFVRRDADQ